MELARPHPAKTNVQCGTPCSKMEPTRETEERKTSLYLEKVCGDRRADVGTLLGSGGSFVPRQGYVEEACGRPLLHTE